MNISITNQIENPLLERTELTFKVTHTGEKPPRKELVRESLAGQLNTKKGLVVIQRLISTFGSQEIEGEAKIYRNADRLREIERAHIRKRNHIEAKKDEGKKEAKE